MIVVLSPRATPADIAHVVARIEESGRKAHPSPDHALSDGAQSLTYASFVEMMRSVAVVSAAVGRTLSGVRASAAAG